MLGGAVTALSFMGVAQAQPGPRGDGRGGASSDADAYHDGRLGLFGPLNQSGPPGRLADAAGATLTAATAGAALGV